jgi:hypothetical protein
MSSYSGRYFGGRDLNLINHFNAELMGDIIQTVVHIFKISPVETKVNVYGETDQTNGKVYFPGVEITALIDRGDITSKDESFGPDRDQSVVFKFREKMLELANIYPQVGDFILFNERYHEIDNVVQELFLGGQSSKSHSIICNTHYSRYSKINLTDRQS